jgi:hypothetical protein
MRGQQDRDMRITGKGMKRNAHWHTVQTGSEQRVIYPREPYFRAPLPPSSPPPPGGGRQVSVQPSRVIGPVGLAISGIHHPLIRTRGKNNHRGGHSQLVSCICTSLGCVNGDMAWGVGGGNIRGWGACTDI